VAVGAVQSMTRAVELLLVEDNPGDAALVKEGLREAHAQYEIHVAPDGEEALRFLRKQGVHQNAQRPDLILLDLNLPRYDGHEVLADIKADPSLRVIPVIILTSSTAPRDIENAYAKGANSYLQKPQTLDQTFDLMKTIEHYWLDFALLPDPKRSY
jgi:two-component system, chemotaxis family, response regulator Rcp1